MGKGFLLLLSLALVAAQDGPVIDTQYGPVRGHVVPVFNGIVQADVNVFNGLPYGNDTSGDNRFRGPLEPESWTEIREADTFGYECPQGRGADPDRFGEDCLNLNLYAPSDQTEGPFPVMVWFHGGGYVYGSNRIYTGHYLAAHGLVIVTVNYRLNDFGFAFTADAAAPGNAGLLDQRLSLIWVQNNIAGFGGDPNKVTIFGQSAGAASTSLHVVSPMSQGLFHQAIMESGTENNIWSMNIPESHPEDYTRELAANVNCTEEDTFEMIDCMRQVPWTVIAEARFRCTPGFFCLGMAPVVDGPGGFLPKKPIELREDGNIMSGPIMTGIMMDDGSLYTVTFFPGSLFGGFNHSEFTRLLNNRFLAVWAPLMDNVTKENALQGIVWNYSPWPYINDEYANRDALNKILTDVAFGMRWDQQAKNQGALAPTYAFVFDYRGRNSSDLVPEWMGIPHSGELAYTWGWTLMQLNPAVRNDSGIFEDDVDWTQEDIDYTIFWNQLFANFAKFGNPTPEPVDAPNDLGPITWPPYTFEETNVLIVHNTSMDVVQEFNQKNYAFWLDYAPTIWGDLPIPINTEVDGPVDAE